MPNIKEIKEAVRTISEVCDSYKECVECPLLDGGVYMCMLVNREPHEWDADAIEDCEGDVEDDNV